MKIINRYLYNHYKHGKKFINKALEAFGKQMNDSGYEITGFQYRYWKFLSQYSQYQWETIRIEDEHMFRHAWNTFFDSLDIIDNIGVIKTKLPSYCQVKSTKSPSLSDQNGIYVYITFVNQNLQ